SDLVGKVVNIASRSAGFITKRFDGKLGKVTEQDKLKEFIDAGEQIAEFYESREFGRAMRRIMELADIANQYVNDEQPWVIARQEGQDDKLQAICTNALNMFRLLMTYLAPVLPKTAQASASFLNDRLNWNQRSHLLEDHGIDPFKPLMNRVDMAQIEKMLEASKEEMPAAVGQPAPAVDLEPIADEIEFGDFRSEEHTSELQSR